MSHCNSPFYLESRKRDFMKNVKILDNGCHEWQGTVLAHGYGWFMLHRSSGYAHRAAFFFAHGHWPKNHACHSCDNRRCVNPDHIFDGTVRENMTDAWKKGRRLGAPPKYSKDTIELIKARLIEGVAQRKIAKEANVSQATVSEIHRGVREYATGVTNAPR